MGRAQEPTNRSNKIAKNKIFPVMPNIVPDKMKPYEEYNVVRSCEPDAFGFIKFSRAILFGNDGKIPPFYDKNGNVAIPEGYAQGQILQEHSKPQYVFYKNGQYRVMDRTAQLADNPDGTPLDGRVLLIDGSDHELTVVAKKELQFYTMMDAAEMGNVKIPEDPNAIFIQEIMGCIYLTGNCNGETQWCIGISFNGQHDKWNNPMLYFQNMSVSQALWNNLSDQTSETYDILKEAVTHHYYNSGVELVGNCDTGTNPIYELLTGNPNMYLVFADDTVKRYIKVMIEMHGSNWIIERLRRFNLTHRH